MSASPSRLTDDSPTSSGHVSMGTVGSGEVGGDLKVRGDAGEQERGVSRQRYLQMVGGGVSTGRARAAAGSGRRGSTGAGEGWSPARARANVSFGVQPRRVISATTPPMSALVVWR